MALLAGSHAVDDIYHGAVAALLPFFIAGRHYYLLTWLTIALSGVGVAAFHPEVARAARAASGDSQQAMSVFSVGGNAGFAVGPLFVAAVRVAAGTRGTVFLAVPAVITGVAVYAVLQRSGHAPARGQPVKRQDGAQDDWGGFALLTSTVIVRSIFSFGLSSLLALYVGTSLHGGRQGNRYSRPCSWRAPPAPSPRG